LTIFHPWFVECSLFFSEEEILVEELAEGAFLSRCLDRLCWWRRRRVRSRKRRRSSGASGDSNIPGSAAAKIIRMDAATETEPFIFPTATTVAVVDQRADSGCQTEMESGDGAQLKTDTQQNGKAATDAAEGIFDALVAKKRNGEAAAAGDGGGRRDSSIVAAEPAMARDWLDYPFLTDRRSVQQLQSSQVPVPVFTVSNCVVYVISAFYYQQMC
jgi:hypothetical protein